MSLEIRNTLNPGLAVCLRALGQSQPILDSMGAELVAVSKAAFSDPGLRPSPWPPPRKIARPPHALLVKTGALRDSIRVLQISGDAIVIGSELPYAAVHQFGGRRVPARPFLPYDALGQMMPVAKARLHAAAAAKLRALFRL